MRALVTPVGLLSSGVVVSRRFGRCAVGVLGHGTTMRIVTKERSCQRSYSAFEPAKCKQALYGRWLRVWSFQRGSLSHCL